MTYLVKLDQDNNPIEGLVDDSNFRALFPETQFPQILTPEVVAGTGYAMFEFSQQPEPQRYEKIERGPMSREEDGRFFETWKVVPMTPEEKADVDANKARQVRSERLARIRATDWIFAPDLKLSQEQIQKMIVLRQHLRDVPQQPGFPWEVTWSPQTA